MADDLVTPILGLTKPIVGDEAGEDLWGEKTNANWDKVDAYAEGVDLALAGAMPEAPMDGQSYARNMGAWVVETGGVSDGANLGGAVPVFLGLNTGVMEFATLQSAGFARVTAEIDGTIVIEGVAPGWEDIPGKPATFPPDEHTHPIDEVDGLPEVLGGMQEEIDEIALDVGSIEITLDGKVDEAPSDNKTYGRKNETWVEAAGAAQIADTAPATGDKGTLWWDSDSGQLYIRYQDVDTTQWVGIGGGPTGDKGDKGDKGDQGDPGADSTVPGPKGDKGDPGVKGDKGDIGNTGATGPMGAAWRNRVVNPCMWVSQEFGYPGGTGALASVNRHTADQWAVSWADLGAALLSTGLTMPSDTGTTCLFITVNTPSASVGPNGYCQMVNGIEGTHAKDFKWGQADAKQGILRFNFYSTITGTFTVHIKNNNATRSWLAPLVVTTANVWKVYTFIVPGDTTGTWISDATGTGIQVSLGFAGGTTYGGGVAGWQAGNKVHIAGGTNGVGVVASYYLTDVGFYIDPDKTGIPPRWEMSDPAQDLIACCRYFEMVPATMNTIAGAYWPIHYKVQKRVAPTMVPVGAYNGAIVGGMAYDPMYAMRQYGAATTAIDVMFKCSARMY